MSRLDPLDLQALREVDIRTVDPDTLVDIRDVQVDMSLPPQERMRDYVRQIGNPYCFRCGDMTVKLRFADTDTTMTQCMERYFRSL